MFTDNEIRMLMDALDALEKSRGQSRVMGMMLRTMMSRSKEEAAAVVDDMKDDEVAEQLLDEQRREDILMLKAKLIQLRRSGR